MSTHADDQKNFSLSETVLDAVLAFQSCHERWEQEEDLARRELWKAACQAAATHIYQLLEPQLERIAYGWLRSGFAPDLQSLKYNLFTPIFLELPHLQVDPQRNVCNLLLTIARRGISDMHRLDTRATRHAPDTNAGDVPNNAHGDARSHISLHENTACNMNVEETLIQAVDNQACLQAIRTFWKRALQPRELQIMKLRQEEYPFKQIGQQVIPAMEEAAVRQCYHRVIARTRAYLRAIGLLLDDNFLQGAL